MTTESGSWFDILRRSGYEEDLEIIDKNEKMVDSNGTQSKAGRELPTFGEGSSSKQPMMFRAWETNLSKPKVQARRTGKATAQARHFGLNNVDFPILEKRPIRVNNKMKEPVEFIFQPREPVMAVGAMQASAW